MATVFPGYSDIVQNLQQAIRAILERHDYVPAQDQVRDLPNLLATLQTYVVSLTGSCRRLGDAYVNALRVYLDAIQRLLSERSSAGQGRAMVYSAGAPNQVGGLRPRQKPELQPPSDVVERRNSLPTRLPLVDAAQLHRAVSHDVGPCTFPESARLVRARRHASDRAAGLPPSLPRRCPSSSRVWAQALDSVMTDVLGEVAHRLGSVSVLEDAEGTPSDEDVRRALHQVLGALARDTAHTSTHTPSPTASLAVLVPLFPARHQPVGRQRRWACCLHSRQRRPGRRATSGSAPARISRCDRALCGAGLCWLGGLTRRPLAPRHASSLPSDPRAPGRSATSRRRSLPGRPTRGSWTPPAEQARHCPCRRRREARGSRREARKIPLGQAPPRSANDAFVLQGRIGRPNNPPVQHRERLAASQQDRLAVLSPNSCCRVACTVQRFRGQQWPVWVMSSWGLQIREHRPARAPGVERSSFRPRLVAVV